MWVVWGAAFSLFCLLISLLETLFITIIISTNIYVSRYRLRLRSITLLSGKGWNLERDDNVECERWMKHKYMYMYQYAWYVHENRFQDEQENGK